MNKKNVLLSTVLLVLSVGVGSARPGQQREVKYLFQSERPVLRFTPQIISELKHAQARGAATGTLPESPEKPKVPSAVPYSVPFSILFKYDTSPNNPEHRCYDITKPISRQVTFLFNFMSLKQYRVNPL